MDMIQIERQLENRSVVEIMTANLQHYLNTDEKDYDVLKAQFASCEYNRITEPVAYFEKSIADIKEHWKEYLWLEQILEEEQSKLVLREMLLAKTTMDTTHIEKAFRPQMLYFDSEIWGELGNEIYADCGAYEGDSILKFVTVCPWYKKIFAFEAIPEVMGRCQKMLESFSDSSIEFVQKAVDKCEQILFFDAGNMHGESCVSMDGTVRVESIPLDTLLNEDVSFIKMDIEGSELDAILGARNIIAHNAPKMAICVYHKVDDFWKIPQAVLEINPDYTFKLRQHDYEVYSETVLYCIPKHQETRRTEKNPETVMHRLCSAVQKLSVYARPENENLLQHGYDKKWFLKQLMGLTIQCESQNAYEKELLEGKQWLEQQNFGLTQELETARQWSAELLDAKQWLEQQNTGLTQELESTKQWNAELQEAKQWLEQQNSGLTQELETAKQWNAELQEAKQWLEQQNSGLTQELETEKQWSAELQEAKQWLEQQNTGLAQELANANLQITELRGWAEELEKGKAYLLEQWQAEEKAHAKTRSIADRMNDVIANHENTIARQKYMLNLLLNDKWVQTVIKLRKISITNS